MRLMIVGSQAHWAIEHHYLAVLKQEVAALEVFPAPDLFAQYYQGLGRKVLFRLGLSTIFQQINQQLLRRVEAFQPDVVWVWKGMEIFPKTLYALRQAGIKLVNYNPDHPFILSSRGSGNANVQRAVPFYDLHFCYHQPLAKEIETRYGIAMASLPFGYSYTDEALQAAMQAEEIPKVSFIGNPDATRIKMLRTLSKAGIPLEVFGHNWEPILRSNATLRVHGPVYGHDFWVAMRRYRVQLNIFRPHNVGSHNMRSFEIPGIGGIMLAPDSPEHRQFFTPDKEIVLYQNEEAMLEKIQYLLSLTAEEGMLIRDAAFQRSIESNYTYADRARQALKILRQL